MKIKIKLILIVAAVAALNFLILFSLIPPRLEKVAVEGMEVRARFIAGIIMPKLTAKIFVDSGREAEELLDQVKKAHNLVYIAAISSSGRLVASLNKSQPDKAKYILSTQQGELSHDRQVYCSVVPVVVKGEEIAKLYIGTL